MARTLFEISEDMQALDDLLEEAGGDVTNPEVEASVDLWLSTLDAEASDKIDNYAAFIQELSARSAERKKEADRLRERARMDLERSQWLKERLYGFFKRHGISKKDTRRFRLSVAKHGGVLPLHVDTAPENLPDRFQTKIIQPNNRFLREALEHGEHIDGVYFGERGESLRIQ